MTSPVFGFIFDQTDNDTLPPYKADFSILGIVLPSDDATPSVFPLNVPTSVNTGDQTVLSGAGTGPLYKTLNQINAQLADLQISAQAVVVRVPMAFQQDGTTEDIDGTIANIVGDPAAGTGIYALLKAPALTGLTPRIVGTPGYTGRTKYAVTAPVITAQGDDYTHPIVTFDPPGAEATATVGDVSVQATAHATLSGGGVGGVAVDNAGQDYGAAPTVSFSGGGGTGAVAHAVLTNGRVTSIVVDNPGSGFTAAPTVTIAAPAGGQITAINLTNPGNYDVGVIPTITITDSNGGVGTGATAQITTMEQLANPICAALPPILNALLAHAPVGGPGGTQADAIAWRGLLSSQRLIPVDDWAIVQDGQATAYIDGAANELGLAVRTDFQHEGYPFWAWANQPVQGILGLKRIDPLSLTDGATVGQELLAAGIGVTVRGDLSDTSLVDSGFVHVSWQNAGTDANYQLYNKTRGRDFVNLALIKSMRQRLGKDNVTLHSVQAVMNDMTAVFTDLATRECEVGFAIGFNASDNTTAGLRAGKFTVYANSEEPAPILQITVKRGLDEAALQTELANLAALSTSAVASAPSS